MKLNILPVCAAGVLSSVAAAQPVAPASPLAGVADLYAPGVALVTTQHQTHDGPAERTGAAFFIGPGKFVTTRALLFKAASASVTLDGGQSFSVARVIGEDVGAGLVIAAAEIPAELRRGLVISPVDGIPGEDALVIGPAARPGEQDMGHPVVPVVVGDRGSAGSFALKGEIPPTLAGSPVLSATGQVLGVVARSGPDGTAPGAVSASRLLEIRETTGLPFSEWAAGTPLPAAEEAAMAAKPHSVEPRPDGSVLVDNRFLLTGDGSREKPYKITWDLLLSAMEEYVPKQGRKNIPQRVMMLSGKYVEIAGNVAFPIMVDQPAELLSMMNPWDGCCIGVPPTPYDAVEVHLSDPATGQARFATYGTVSGRLRVEPQLVGNWLVGLYVMDDAKLNAGAFGGFSP